MPVIPTYKRHVSLPAQSGMVQKDSRAIEKYYGAVSQAGEAISDFYTKMYEAKQVTELSNAQTDALKQLTEFESGLRDRQDFDNFEPEYEKKVQELRNHYQKNLMDNKVKQAFASDFDRMSLQTGLSVRSITNKKRIDHGSASYFNNMTTLKGMLPGADETLKQEIHNKFKIQTSGAVAAGYLTEEQGAKELYKFGYDVTKASAWDDAKNLGYKEGIAWLQDEKNASGLERSDRNSMINNLKMEWGLNNAYEKEAKETALRDTRIRLMKAADRNELTLGMIYESGLPAVGQGSIETFKNMLPHKKQLEVSDPTVFNKLYKDAVDGSIKDPKTVISMINKDLTKSDATFLINANETFKGKAESPKKEALKRALKYIEASIVRSALTGPTAAEAKDVYKVTMVLEKALAAGENKGKDYIDMLDPESKDYIADKILRANARSPKERMADGIRDMAEDFAGSDDKSPLRKKGETIEEYDRRLGVK